MTNGPTEYPEPIKNPKYKFKVIIIGAGLGGCANAMAMHYQGFDVVMYEKIREFQRLGDSLGLGENALKLLRRWGVDKQIVAIGNKSPTFTIRRWYDGKEMTKQRLMDMGMISRNASLTCSGIYRASRRLSSSFLEPRQGTWNSSPHGHRSYGI
jgi:2-polyprenyl-6-methoxyphenol hydroxylase-like FAD-dependent oxidoreductase